MHRIHVCVLAIALCACSGEPDSPEGPGIPEGTCLPISDYLHTTAFLPSDAASAVGASGDHAFMGDDTGLRVFDITDPYNPVERGGVDTTGTPTDIETNGDLVYVAWGATGVVIIDAGDSDRPVIVGAVPTPGNAVSIALDDSCAFVADDVIGLVIVDVRDPAAPAVIGVENTPGNATGVAVSSPVALVSDRSLGLRVVNVADPTRPFLVRSVPTPGSWASGVEIYRNRGYVADGFHGLHVVDLSGSIIDTQRTEGAARGVVAENGVVYVFGDHQVGTPQDTRSVLEVFDASNRDNLSFLLRLETNGVTANIFVDAGRLFTADGRVGARIVDADPAGAPPSTYTLLSAGDDIRDVEQFDSSHLVLADVASGLVVASMENGGLSVVGSLGGIGAPTGVTSWRDTVFLAMAGGGVLAVDASDVTAPSPIGAVPASLGTISLTTHGGHLYMAKGFGGVTSWAANGATQPETVSLQALATDVAVSGDYAYIVSRQRFYMATAPDMQLANSTPEYGAGETIEIEVIDDGVFPRPFAFIGVAAGGPGVGVVIVDLINPLFPVFVNHVATAAVPLDIAVGANLMYVAQGSGGLEVFDISELGDVRRLGFFPGQYTFMSATIAGDTVFGASSTAGVFSTPLSSCVRPGN